MRPIVEKRYIFIGHIEEQKTNDALEELTQNERDSLLQSGLDHLALTDGSGKLGVRFFTIVGNQSFGESMERIGKDNVEPLLLSYITKTLRNA